MELNIFCRCYKNNYEIKYSLFYGHEKHTVEFINENVKLDAIIQNIGPGFTPAFEITNDNCKIKLSNTMTYFFTAPHARLFLIVKR